MREELVKKRIKEILGRFGMRQDMPASNMYGSNGMADHIGCCRGRYIAIEAKGHGGKLSKLQAEFGQDILDNGGIWLVIDHKNFGDLSLMLYARGMRYPFPFYKRHPGRRFVKGPMKLTNNWNRHAAREPDPKPYKARHNV